MASAIPVKSACVFQCSSFSWRAVKIARPFKRKQDLRVFKSISAALMDMMLSWPHHFDWLRQRWVHKSTILPAFSVQLSKCLVFFLQSAQSQLKAAFDSKTNALRETLWHKWKTLRFISFPCHSSSFLSKKIWSHFLSRPWVFPHRNEGIVIAG